MQIHSINARSTRSNSGYYCASIERTLSIADRKPFVLALANGRSVEGYEACLMIAAGTLAIMLFRRCIMPLFMKKKKKLFFLFFFSLEWKISYFSCGKMSDISCTNFVERDSFSYFLPFCRESFNLYEATVQTSHRKSFITELVALKARKKVWAIIRVSRFRIALEYCSEF